MIKATITDATALDTINHQAVISYLEAHEWENVGHFTRPIGKVPIMQHVDGDSCVVPLPEAGDYAQRISDIIRTLSRIEGRSELDIFTDFGGDIGNHELL